MQQGLLIKVTGFARIQEGKTVPRHCFSQQSGRASLPTTYLQLQLMSDKMSALSVGRLKSNTFELKQLTGVAAILCRKARIQPQSFGGKLPPKIWRCNHIACAMLVWSRLKVSAYKTGKTVAQIKHGMLSDYLIEQLRNPFVKMSLA